MTSPHPVRNLDPLQDSKDLHEQPVRPPALPFVLSLKLFLQMELDIEPDTKEVEYDYKQQVRTPFLSSHVSDARFTGGDPSASQRRGSRRRPRRRPRPRSAGTSLRSPCRLMFLKLFLQMELDIEADTKLDYDHKQPVRAPFFSSHVSV